MPDDVICIPPTSVDPRDTSAVEKMLASHAWKPKRIETQRIGLYIHQACSRCGTDSTCIITRC